jgi:hypothetical protein
MQRGRACRCGRPCCAWPTLSTHGYEVIRRDAIAEMSAVLVEFLLRQGQMPRSKVRMISGATVCRGNAPAMACSLPRRINP